MGLYNRADAVRYAMRWALARNPSFPNYSSNHGGGGDCSNFVSQCLLAGGWAMLEGTRENSTAWFAEETYTSRTWSSAQWFYEFLNASPRTSRCDEDELALGDVMMLQPPDAPHPDHAMLVTHITGLSTFDGEERQISLSYHSTDKLNNPLREIKSRQSSKTKYFCFKINDTFSDYSKQTPDVMLF
ncbi:MAG TPA: amidase domain-containing protein [Pirellulales bacterium]|nr:amidase domain-containing protein [Pirellulales bacterium]